MKAGTSVSTDLEMIRADLYQLHTSSGANPQTGDPLPSLLELVSEALEPGTARAGTERFLSDSDKERMEAESRKDRAAKLAALKGGISGPGYSAAPVRVDVVDAEADAYRVLWDLEERICLRLGARTVALATTAERCKRVDRMLDGLTDHLDLLMYVGYQVKRLVRKLRAVVGDREQINKITEPCPFCGRPSLRAFPEREIVACVNARCNCGNEDCRCARVSRPGTHRWTRDQWGLLGGTLEGITR